MYETENIRRLVKEIDRRFDCYFDYPSESYVISQTSPLGQTSRFMSVRYDCLDRDIFEALRKTVYENINGTLAEKAIRSMQEHAERSEQKLDEISSYVAKTTEKDLKKAYEN
jgi:hypothetical protein